MLHPHKRNLAGATVEGNSIEVVLDRSLGRARDLPKAVPALRGSLLSAFRRFMRDGA